MATTVEGKCKHPGNKVMDGEYGKYRDAVFTLADGSEVRVFASKGKPEFEAVTNLERGETYTLLAEEKKQGDGYRYSLLDDDIERLTGANGQQGGDQGAPPSGGEQPDSLPQNVDLSSIDALCALLPYVYKKLDTAFRDRDLSEPPTSEDIRNMTNTIVIQIAKSRGQG